MQGATTEDLDYQDSLGNRVIRNLRGLHHEVLQIWEVPRDNPTLIIVENGPFGITPMIESEDDEDDDGPILGDKMLGAERPVPGNPNKNNIETYQLSKVGVAPEQAIRDTSGAIKKLETSVRRKLSRSYDETRSLGNRSYSLCPPESVPKPYDSNTRHRNWPRRAQSLSASFPPTIHDAPDQTPTTSAFNTPRTATPRPSPISDPRLRRSMVAATGTPSPSSSTTSITRSPAFRRRESNQIPDLDLDRSLPPEPPVSPTARWATSPNASPNSIQITPTEAYSPPNSPFLPPFQRASPRLRRTRPLRLPSPAAFASRAASPLATSTSTSDATPLATPSVGLEDEAEAESQAELLPLPVSASFRSQAVPKSSTTHHQQRQRQAGKFTFNLDLDLDLGRRGKKKRRRKKKTRKLSNRNRNRNRRLLPLQLHPPH
ncbi:hypothetical protein NEMBOFW57_007704 [Staphylotrichum longicolle]|uniref:Uncharacterized protein n=1 Tax=Staphylotrichum longicolle TaxID=669026 RepID=A0AAD4EV88_9PEZI|nr:hypothetical protein NEMBOFW57_007704 [Staphylotrichum longicolle]